MSAKLYVGNLPYSATEDFLKERFEQFGTVESATVITDRDTGRSKGFGFVEMGTDQEAVGAIAVMNGSEMDGRTLKVSEAKPQISRDGSGQRNGLTGSGHRRW
jgi:cold-inducible RNA-binding protein